MQTKRKHIEDSGSLTTAILIFRLRATFESSTFQTPLRALWQSAKTGAMHTTPSVSDQGLRAIQLLLASLMPCCCFTLVVGSCTKMIKPGCIEHEDGSSGGSSAW